MRARPEAEVFDWEIISMMSAGSREAFRMLVERYETTGRKLICRYRIQKGVIKYGPSDLRFIYLDALYKAACFYNRGGVAFRAFFLRVYNRDLNNFFKAEIGSGDAMSRSLSLDEPRGDGETFYDVIPDEAAVDPREGYALSSIRLVLSEPRAYPGESELQRRMLILRIAGHTYREIAEAAALDVSKVRRLLSRDDKETPLGKIKLKLGR